MKRKRELLAAACAALVTLLAVWAIGVFLRPMRTEFGANWGGYLQEERDTVDVMFFGSSLTYCDVAPGVLWDEAGIASYVLAGPEQTIPMSYYYIREALRTQSPSVIFLEVTGLYYNQYTNFTKANVDYMPLSWNRLQATLHAAEKEQRFGLLVPAFNYHDRWRSISKGEIAQRLRGYAPDDLAGYTFLTEAEPMTEVADRVLSDAAYAQNLEYFGKIATLCEEQGITLIPYLAPGYSRIPADKLARMRTDVAALGLTLLDCNDCFDAFGFDPARDFYDTLHTNCYGAEKFSRWLGQYLLSQGYNTSGRADPALWEARAEEFAEKLRAAKSDGRSDADLIRFYENRMTPRLPTGKARRLFICQNACLAL